MWRVHGSVPPCYWLRNVSCRFIERSSAASVFLVDLHLWKLCFFCSWLSSYSLSAQTKSKKVSSSLTTFILFLGDLSSSLRQLASPLFVCTTMENKVQINPLEHVKSAWISPSMLVTSKCFLYIYRKVFSSLCVCCRFIERSSAASENSYLVLPCHRLHRKVQSVAVLPC